KFMDFLAVENNINLTNEDKDLIYSYVGGKARIFMMLLSS
ncbi:MAG: ATP-binding protein, partial [Methanococci archaeon]|nr:ATP-binding protein [Methanococci archaeon]